MSWERDPYVSGTYAEQNPSWHSEDSPGKAGQIAEILRRNGLVPTTVCEVGCGVGGVLVHLREELGGVGEYCGFDVSRHAIQEARWRHESITFEVGDPTERPDRYGLVLCVDVFEHVPDYLGFLEKLSRLGDHFVFRVPLDLTVLAAAMPRKLTGLRETLGHLHYFNRQTAEASLRQSGYVIADSQLVPPASPVERSLLGRAVHGLRSIVGWVDPDLATRLVGGYSLLVLANVEAAPRPGGEP